MIKIPIIVQAAYYSKIYEGKATAELVDNKDIISYLYHRLKSKMDDSINICLATSQTEEDDILAQEAEKLGFTVVRGEEHNLVARLLKACEELGSPDHFIRIMGNSPLVDISAMQQMAETHVNSNYDYSYNEHRAGVPYGMGCEIIALRVLKKLQTLNLNDEQKESGLIYVRQNSGEFNINRSCSDNSHPEFKLKFETDKDLQLLKDVASNVDEPTAEAVIKYLEKHPLLAKSNRIEPCKEVGLEKLFLNTEKAKSLQQNKIDFLYPVSVELSLTNRCNLKCVYCSDSKLRDEQGHGEELNKDTLFRFFDDLKAGGTKGVVIEGGGEPTIHREFSDVVKYLCEIGLAAGLITNGTRFIDPEILKHFEWIRVSVDASNDTEWKNLKGPDLFSEVMKNIHTYAQYCPTVGVGYVVTKNNVSEVENFILRVKQLGVSYVQFRPVIDNPELTPSEDDLNYLKLYQAEDFAIIIDGMTENATSGNNNLPCKAHSLTTVVTADGSVYICGRLNIHSWLSPIGNIKNSSFSDIWQSSERKKQADQVLDPEYCKEHCPQCRISKFNSLLTRLDKTKSRNFI
jgi:radical SAM protein with 4Fe4S-binding SPASM domain